jgi:hypothetical protein
MAVPDESPGTVGVSFGAEAVSRASTVASRLAAAIWFE